MMEGIKNVYVLQRIFKYIPEGQYLKILNHNKKMQKRLKISLEDFKNNLNQMIIEMKSKNNASINNLKLNFIGEPNKLHIYSVEENKDINKNGNISGEAIKIRLVIDYDKKMNLLKGLFKSCTDIETLSFIKFNRRDILDMSDMFMNCESLTKINISKLKTDSVITMENMFSGCKELQSIDLSNLNTDNVSNMKGIFNGCQKLLEVNISHLNTDYVEDTSLMFNGCSSLIAINISNLINLKNMERMFYECSSLKELNLSDIINNKVQKMSKMFYKCSSIGKIENVQIKT